jgi:hypothetical protein
MRRTPRAITAMPPMTIHGTLVAFSALVRPASARSRRRSLSAGLLGIVLDPSPTAAHLENRRLAYWIARARPHVHRIHGVRGGQRLGHCLRWARPLARSDLTTSRRGELLASPPTPHRCSLITLHRHLVVAVGWLSSSW